MKNINYNLIKMLHNTLDDLWRLEKYYIADAEECEGCKTALKEIKADISEHAEKLKEELAKHASEGKLD